MSVSADSLPPDVATALMGGETFDRRLAALVEATRANELSAASLKTAGDVAAILAEAKQAREQAFALKAEYQDKLAAIEAAMRG